MSGVSDKILPPSEQERCFAAPSRGRTLALGLARQRVFLVVLLLLTGRYALQLPLLQNETDVLPLARQALNPHWLPHDWYLNQPPGYRTAFDFTVGWLVTLLPIETGVVIGRLLSFVLFAFALQVLAQTLQLSARWLVLALLAFLLLFNQSLVAGEWMVSGLEAKPFAYSFCLLALAALLRRQYAWASFLLGLSITSHVLVGLYATLCAGAMLWLHRQRLAGAGRRLLTSAGCFLAASALGWWSVVQHLLEPGGEVARAAARVYVHFRVPWHLLPSYWLTHEAMGRKLAGGAACVAVLAAVACRHRDERHRMVAAFALASLGLFAVGLFWAALGADGLLTFYWFRFPDTIVPFSACLLLADLLAAGLRRWRYGRLASGAVLLVCLAALIEAAVSTMYQARARLAGVGPVPADYQNPARWEVQRWVQANTPPQAVFFVDPFWSEFYWLAERARFVSFKHFPQTAAEIVEWYHRLAGRDANPLVQAPTSDPRDGFQQRFRHLSAADIRTLANDYGLTHAIVDVDTDPFQHELTKPVELHRNERYIVYDLHPAPAGQ